MADTALDGAISVDLNRQFQCQNPRAMKWEGVFGGDAKPLRPCGVGRRNVASGKDLQELADRTVDDSDRQIAGVRHNESIELPQVVERNCVTE
jgi:hypothetical protein